MKFSLYFVLLFSYPFFSQVGINTNLPKTTLDVRSTNHNGAVTALDGVTVPRVNALSIDGVEKGQLVYLITDAGTFKTGFHFWNGTVWTPLDTTIEPWYGTDDNKAATLNTENIYTMGKVGIGTSVAPTSKLHIQGDATITTLNKPSNTGSGLYPVVADENGYLQRTPVGLGTIAGGYRPGDKVVAKFDFNKDFITVIRFVGYARYGNATQTNNPLNYFYGDMILSSMGQNAATFKNIKVYDSTGILRTDIIGNNTTQVSIPNTNGSSNPITFKIIFDPATYELIVVDGSRFPSTFSWYVEILGGN